MKAPIMYSPMMGIGASIDLYTETPAVTIEDVMFDNTTVGELAPLESPKDYHDTWDLDGTDFTPEVSPDDEGFWDDFENIVLNGDYEELGSELVPSGTFSSFSVQSGDVTISGDTASFVDGGTNTNSRVQLLNVLTANKIYKVVFSVTRYVAGGVQIILGGANAVGVNISAGVGTYTVYITAGSSTSVQIKRWGSFPNFDFDLTNISIKQVDPNDRWTLDSGWSIEDGKLIATSTDLEATQTNVFTPGNTYEITFTIDSIASGSVKVKAGTSTGTIRTSAGTYTQILDVAFGTSLVLDMHASGSCVIDNVIVKEYAITPLDV